VTLLNRVASVGVVLFASMFAQGQVTFSAGPSTQSPDGRHITMLPSTMSNTLGQNFIGWGELSDTVTLTHGGNVTLAMIEHNQHPFSQIDGPNGPPAITPMTVYVYTALPNGDLTLFITQYFAPGTAPLSIGNWPTGTQIQLFATGGIPAPISQCFIYCGWQIDVSVQYGL